VVKARDTELLRKLAAEFNLTYNAFGASVSKQDSPSRGNLTLTDAWDAALEPAPVTPTDEDAVAYQLLSGTIKAAYNAHHADDGKDTFYVSPGIMSGNTGE
jgi:Gly-Xaa carboxypeptidase